MPAYLFSFETNLSVLLKTTIPARKCDLNLLLNCQSLQNCVCNVRAFFNDLRVFISPKIGWSVSIIFMHPIPIVLTCAMHSQTTKKVSVRHNKWLPQALHLLPPSIHRNTHRHIIIHCYILCPTTGACRVGPRKSDLPRKWAVLLWGDLWTRWPWAGRWQGLRQRPLEAEAWQTLGVPRWPRAGCHPHPGQGSCPGCWTPPVGGSTQLVHWTDCYCLQRAIITVCGTDL